jgi:hypothetical protein
MDAVAASLLSIFEKKIRLEVPLFQRQYVWSEDHQWAPLWEDICRKFSEYLEGRKDAPAHFLGAMVLDQKQTPTTQRSVRMVVTVWSMSGPHRLLVFRVRPACGFFSVLDGFRGAEWPLPCFAVPTTLPRSLFPGFHLVGCSLSCFVFFISNFLSAGACAGDRRLPPQLHRSFVEEPLELR